MGASRFGAPVGGGFKGSSQRPKRLFSPEDNTRGRGLPKPCEGFAAVRAYNARNGRGTTQDTSEVKRVTSSLGDPGSSWGRGIRPVPIRGAAGRALLLASSS
jgi:hypothetical protein